MIFTVLIISTIICSNFILLFGCAKKKEQPMSTPIQRPKFSNIISEVEKNNNDSVKIKKSEADVEFNFDLDDAAAAGGGADAGAGGGEVVDGTKKK
uniref:Lipoprotein n=1 Tax=Panagrolaimus sp. PS1159 TaxID=55785 RepID=A0AC35GHK9_9BILA